MVTTTESAKSYILDKGFALGTTKLRLKHLIKHTKDSHSWGFEFFFNFLLKYLLIASLVGLLNIYFTYWGHTDDYCN